MRCVRGRRRWGMFACGIIMSDCCHRRLALQACRHPVACAVVADKVVVLVIGCVVVCIVADTIRRARYGVLLRVVSFCPQGTLELLTRIITNPELSEKLKVAVSAVEGVPISRQAVHSTASSRESKPLPPQALPPAGSASGTIPTLAPPVTVTLSEPEQRSTPRQRLGVGSAGLAVFSEGAALVSGSAPQSQPVSRSTSPEAGKAAAPRKPASPTVNRREVAAASKVRVQDMLASLVGLYCEGIAIL